MPEKSSRWIVHRDQLSIIIRRLAWQLIERFFPFEETALLALPPNGIEFGRRLSRAVASLVPEAPLPFGIAQIKDEDKDASTQSSVQIQWETQQITTDNTTLQRIILADDVLFTGTNVFRAMTQLTQSYPNAILDLVVLVERRGHRRYPIVPTIRGLVVDVVTQEWVRVWWSPRDPQEGITIETQAPPHGSSSS